MPPWICTASSTMSWDASEQKSFTMAVCRGKSSPLCRERAHGDTEPLAHLPEDVRLGHAAALEHELRAGAPSDAHLIELRPHLVPGRPLLDEERGHAAARTERGVIHRPH